MLLIIQADGFGIGWYDPLPHPPLAEVVPKPVVSAGIDANKDPVNGDYFPVIQLAGNGAYNAEARPHGVSDEEKAAELLRKRELEQELQNERPCIFKSITPAWSNANLTRLAEKIRSPLVLSVNL